MDWGEAYLAAIEVALQLMVPVSLIITGYAWLLVWRYRGHRIRLPLVMAVVCSIAGACTTWLSWTILYRSRVGPLPSDLLPVTATVVLALNVIPLVSVGYLVLLDVMDLRRPDR